MTDLTQLALDIRRDIVELTYRAGRSGSHVGGALSSADILAALYGKIIRHNPQKPDWLDRDRFLLSKGHSAVGLYSVLHRTGYINDDEFYTFEANCSDFPGHCVLNQNKGIELSSGSLGLGLSFGVGSALAGKKRKKLYRVFVLMGNGECNEGSVWEAINAAPNWKLDNLVAIVDFNKLQLDGESSKVLDMSNLASRFSSFGWQAMEVDGHDIKSLCSALETHSDKPLAIIAHTIKGKGISFMENVPQWHHASLSETQYKEAMTELGVEV